MDCELEPETEKMGKKKMKADIAYKKLQR